MWAGHKTEWAEARAIAAWALVAHELGDSRWLALGAHAKDKDLGVYANLAYKLQAATEAVQTAFSEVQKITRPSLPIVFAAHSYEIIELKRLLNKFGHWRDSLHLINEWVATRNAITRLRSEGLDHIADGLVAGTISPQEARSVTELLIAESLWRRATQQSPELLSIDGDTRNECVLEFRDFDQQRIRAARHEVLANHLAKRPNGHVGAMGVIRAEINRHRGHRPIRRLMTDAGSAIQHLKPIFLMSRLSVAQFIPPGRVAFDLLVIDEASQVAPEDALGVLARAKQAIVVGDDKQLPRTNFF